MSKRIGMVLGKKFPPDVRVEKEARSLTGAGFEVHLLCLAEPDKASEDTFEGMQVHRWLTLRKNRTGRLDTIKNFKDQLTFVFNKCKKDISKFIRDFNIDVIHVHDLPLVQTAISARARKDIQIVADFHENYPATVQRKQRQQGWSRLIGKYLDNYNRWSKHEKLICNHVNHVIVVVEEMKDHLIKIHGLPDEKISVITNTESTRFVTNCKIYDKIIDRYSSDYTLLYIGGIGPHRGLDTAVKGMKRIKEKEPAIKLLIVGKGRDSVLENLNGIIFKDHLEPFVEIVGWQPFDYVYSYIKACKVGLIPHHFGEHTDNTVPHKLFQYMMAGKPVLVSSCRPLARIVGQMDSGLVFQAGDPEDFAKKVLTLYENQEQYEYFSNNAVKHTLHGQWNWDHTGQQLVNFYSNL